MARLLRLWLACSLIFVTGGCSYNSVGLNNALTVDGSGHPSGEASLDYQSLHPFFFGVSLSAGGGYYRATEASYGLISPALVVDVPITQHHHLGGSFLYSARIMGEGPVRNGFGFNLRHVRHFLVESHGVETIGLGPYLRAEYIPTDDQSLFSFGLSVRMSFGD